MKIRTFLIEFVAILGVSSIVYGVWLMHQPTAFLVGGLFALGYSVLESFVVAKNMDNKK